MVTVADCKEQASIAVVEFKREVPVLKNRRDINGFIICWYFLSLADVELSTVHGYDGPLQKFPLRLWLAFCYCFVG